MTKVCKPDDEGTFAGTHGNGEGAPIPVVRRHAVAIVAIDNLWWPVSIAV
jgi:hypothetical protein